MIVTDHFIYIHYNKTGGTFVTHHVKDWARRNGYAIQDRNGQGWKHAGVSRIAELPYELRDLPICAGMRNPFDLYVSDYEFKYWQLKHSNWLIPRDDMPFHAWMGHIHDYPCRRNIADEVYDTARAKGHGYLTMDFALVFADDPVKALTSKRAFKAALNKINWMHTETLNADLAALLNSIQPRSGDFVLDQPRKFPLEGGRGNNDWEPYYSDELKAQVLTRDAWLFEVFDEYRCSE